MKEEWKPVVGFEGLYEVSDQGRVMSARSGRLRIPHPLRYGYLIVMLCKQGQRINRRIHHLVLEAFVGPRPPGAHACHIDDDRDNNALPNLKWASMQENHEDRRRNRIAKGLPPHTTAKLSSADVARILKDYRTQAEIAADYGVNRSSISLIRSRRTWLEITAANTTTATL